MDALERAKLVQPIKAYQGGPHSVGPEGYDNSKIGTGEGAAAYGHGHYFAEAEPIARHYRDSLTKGAGNMTIDGEPFHQHYTSTDPEKRLKAKLAIAMMHGDRDINSAIDWHRQQVMGKLSSRHLMEEDVPEYMEDLKRLTSYKENPPVIKKNQGHMHEVAIHAHPDNFLDWDKPLSEQHETIRRLAGWTPEHEALHKAAQKKDTDSLLAALEGNVQYTPTRMPARPQGSLPMDAKGEDIYRHLQDKMGALDWPADADLNTRNQHRNAAAQRASQHLLAHGIRGIRYRDANSRGENAEPTHNYVIFDPKDIEIMRRYANGGDVEGYKKGGSPELDKVREALSRTVSPFSDNPEHVKEALRIAGTLKVPQGTKAGTGSFYNLVSPHAVADVKSTVTNIPNVTHHDPRQMTWEDLVREGQGGSFINVAGDRTNFGRLTHINDKELAWPVDLHAGPKYMLEPNKGEVWANNPTHATGFYNKIMEAGKKGPVYGIYAPMGAQSGDFAHHMFDALMAQIPNSNLTKEGAEAFNKIVKAGLHRPEKDRAKARELMKNWPGIENPKEASEFARNLPGSHRAGMVKQLDSKFMRDMGMPDVGVTRVAITDPAMRNVAGNMIGHRVVRFDPSRMGPPERSFAHTSYPSATFGEYVGDLPLVQRHYAAPDVTEKQLAKRAGKEKNVIIHPYSMDATGRGTYRKAFEEQKQIQPINQRMLESVQQGMENQKLYGLKKGGRTAYKKGGKVEGSIWHDRDVFDDGGEVGQHESLNAVAGRTGENTEADATPPSYSDMPDNVQQAQLDLNNKGREANEATSARRAGEAAAADAAFNAKNPDFNTPTSAETKAEEVQNPQAAPSAALSAEAMMSKAFGPTTSFGQQPPQAGLFTPEHFESTLEQNLVEPAFSQSMTQPAAPHTPTPTNDLTGIAAPAGTIDASPLGATTSNATTRGLRDAITQNLGPATVNTPAPTPVAVNTPSADLSTSKIAGVPPAEFTPITPNPVGYFFDRMFGGLTSQGVQNPAGYSLGLPAGNPNAQQGQALLDQNARTPAVEGNRGGKTHMVQKLMPDGTYQWVEEPYKKGGRVYRRTVGSQMTDHVISKFGAKLPASNYQPTGNKAGRR
jgi:hypothetical protein